MVKLGKIRSVIYSFCILLVSAVLVISLPTTSYSVGLCKISQDELEVFARNDILYYCPRTSTTISCSSEGAVTTGENKDYKGNPILSSDQLAKINSYQPLYEQAASTVGIPWAMLAAIHVRESNLSRVNPNRNGIFQILAVSVTPGQELSDAEFIDQATKAANHLKGSMGGSTDDNAIKRAFFAYNGRATVYKTQARDLGFSESEAENGEGSPYVMNKADEKRDPNKNPTGWGQIKTDGGSISYPANQDYGAFVIYKALGGESAVTICTEEGGEISGNNNILSQKAIEFAWPIDDQHATAPNGSDLAMIPTEAYRAALEQTGLSSKGRPVSVGASCDAFIAAVVRTTGVDPNYQCCGVANQIAYLTGEGASRWREVTGSTLQAGDILIINNGSSQHTKMVVDLGGNKLGTAQASYNDFTGRLSTDLYTTGYRAFRAIGL